MKKDRIAIVAGLRTPFARQATYYFDQTPVDLGSMVVSELLSRTGIDPKLVDRLIYGMVSILPEMGNIAREVVLGSGMDVHTDAYTVTRACATGFQSIASIAQGLEIGEIKIGVSGGVDTTTVVPIQLSRALANTLVKAQKAKTVKERLDLFRELSPADLAPNPPSPMEYSTGLSMGQVAEQMAKTWSISRREQDRLGVRSHQRAMKAWNSGVLDDEVMHVNIPPFRETLTRDNNVRDKVTLAGFQKLKPAFDRKHGTVTAATSSPLTDGATAQLMMKESTARALGLKPIGYVVSYGFAALEADWDMLAGPSYATPLALDRAGMELGDLDLVEVHEAFAAQVLANLKMFESKKFAADKLGRSKPIGKVDMDKFNVMGSSIAYGHPFAATGGRMAVQMCRELGRRGGGRGLITACAAGGLGAAMIVESE